MSDQVEVKVVTLTVPEVEALVYGAVRRALAEQATTDRHHQQDLAGEELTLRDVMTLFKIRRRQTVWAWRRERGFPAPHRRGGLTRWLRTEVDDWRVAQETSGPGTTSEPRGRKPREARAATAAH